MKKLIKRLTSLFAVAILVLSASAIVFSGKAHAIPYTPGGVPGLDHPAFNVYTGVPSYGNEADFLTGHVAGSSNPYTDPVNDACANGTQFGVRVYVHNGANQDLNKNGTGPAVAHNTKVKVSVPGTTASNLVGTISASNAASVSDTLKINCNGKTMQLSYVTGSAIQQRMDGSTTPLSDSIVTTGAPVGTKTPNGDMWGCFEQRVLVFLKVKVTETPKPPVEKFACTIGNFEIDGRTVKLTIAPKVQNVTVVAYDVNWGDGSENSTTATSSHTYTKDGTFKITAKFQVRKANGQTEWVTSEECNKSVTFSPTTPQVKPTHLINTGAGSIVGIFAATTAAGAFLHRKWLKSRV